MKFLIKKLYADTVIPSYHHDADAAFDVVSREDYTLQPGERHLFGLGFSAEFDAGYVCHVWDRSGLAAKQGVTTLGGVIDAGYRSEYGVILLNTSNAPVIIRTGDRIAQLVIQKIEQVTITEVDQLSETTRGGGWGSSGR